MKKITILLVAMLAFCWQGHAQFTESFDAEIPATWTVVDVDGGNTWVHSTAQSYAGGGSARITYNSGAHDDYLISPQFTVTAGVSDRISFWAASYLGYIESFEVLLSTTGVAPGDFSVSLGDELASTDAPVFEQFSYDLSAYDGTPIYIAIKATGANQFYLYVDEFVNDAAPTCTPAVVDSSTVVDDCGSSQFSVDVVVSSVGDGTVITDGLGGMFTVASGLVTAGPYATGTNVTLTVEHSDPACNFSLGNFQYFCPPSNIDCANATPMVCGDTINGSSVGSTGNQEGSGCSIGDNGIWFTFTGTGGDMTVESTASFDHEMAITSGTCGSLVNIICDDGTGSGGTESYTFTSSPGETYYVYIAHYASGNTTTGTIDITLTCAAIPTCFEATNLDVTVLPGDTSATLSWDVEGSATSGYNWAVMTSGQDPDVDAPVALGSTAVGVTSDTATGLTAGNDYDFYVQSNCDTNGLSTWAGPVNFTSTAPPVNDECGAATALTVDPDYSCASAVSGTTIAATQSLPGCLGTANDDVWYSFVATGDSHRIMITNTGGSSDIVTEVFDACGGTSLVCQDTPNSPIDLTGLTSGNTYFFRIYTWSSLTSTTTSFDVCVGTPPTCPAPTSLTASNLTETSADLGWTENGTAAAWDIEWGTNGFTPTGTPSIEDTATNPHTLGGLTATTSYDFYVRADCGGGDTSAWAGPYTFTTNAPAPANDECGAAIALTVNADYACGTVTSGTVLGATNSGVDVCGGFEDDDVWYSFIATATEHRVSLINIAGSTTDMYHAVYDATPGCGALTTSVICNDGNTSNLTGLTIGNTYFVQVYTWTNTPGQTSTFDVCVGTPPTCPATTSLTASNLTETSADLGWTENGTATAWDIEWGTVGFTPTGVPNIEDTATNPHTLGGLTASTSYDFYVRADCGGGDTSDWTGPYTFVTADPPPACGGNFYDDGGIASDYSNSANITTTICPDVPGDAVNVTFTFFSTENSGSTGCYDGLTIHDGPDASAPTINPTTGTIWCWDRDDATPGGTGDLQGMTITSTDGSGCLTFVFTSDSGVTREGWEATVGCSPLGLEDYGLTGFTYFPNPVNNTLSLRGVKDIQNVTIYNMLGQEVLRTAPNSVNSDVDMSELQTGTYFVKVMIENTTKTIKVIKK
ncbi:T9SS-dependent choice-of-anchor J family protein [Xanthomarina sp. F2636L]|uniref:T9SS-dependent choice-of-anchor J family protein n=1 Tax=Xanthomarina sp. F2636L TaxID=2996018 RepID=UPI00225E362D|nr:choice-of-anchor J domain-containing protein [Xanthomarina sp. F2636L]MCX7552186.1 choice-of-anchor J domain-containing protein [Xanthomarina sp. F2636L]